VLSGLWPPSFTLKHTLEALFYDQTHATPPFFTMKHTEFTPKHMIRAANGIWEANAPTMPLTLGRCASHTGCCAAGHY
jgi:hypothetical protein